MARLAMASKKSLKLLNFESLSIFQFPLPTHGTACTFVMKQHFLKPNSLALPPLVSTILLALRLVQSSRMRI
jgi:hypothetical protein